MKILYVLAVFLLLVFFCNAQQLFTENFSYTSGQALTSNNWTQLGSNSSNPISVSNVGLIYSGYVLSNIGGAASIGTSGQIVYRDGLNNIGSGSIYTSFMINVSVAQTTGDYFFSILTQGSTNVNTSFNRVYIKAASNGYYKLGISKLADAPVYGNDSFAIGTTIRVVTKYSFVSGSNNDSCLIWGFNSGVPSAEPSTVGAVANGSSYPDASALGRFVLRQGISTNSATLVIDGIRSATNWADLNTATTNLPPFVSAATFAATSINTATISWTPPTSYNSSTMKTLVFLKSSSSISLGTPNVSSNYYAASSDFSVTASTYQNDASAKCVFVGDSNSVSISNLNQGTNYFALIYIVRNTDSVYSTAVTASGTTPSSAPGAITLMSFISGGTNSAIINWTKPAGYNNVANTMLIFVKPGSVITVGTPNENPNNIVANPNFTGNGTRYQNDTFAHCVYKGDTNFVYISGLNAGTTYHILAYAVNDIDSNYSTPETAGGATNLPTPVAGTGLTFTATGATSANITWTKNVNYSNTFFTTLVFVKQNALITNGTPNANPNIYTANALFTSGTPYQNDGSAFCVYKGDSNIVSITGLNAGTTYSVLVYVVRDADSLYSSASNTSGTTGAAPPPDVTGVTFSGLSSTRAQISWTLLSGFNTSTMRLLVFVKQGSPINAGTPTRTATYYTANTSLGSGTPYQNDPSAYCVLRSIGTGPPPSVTVTNLNMSSTYYVLVYVIRLLDSSYSYPGATANGTTQPAGDVTGLTFGGTGTTSAQISWTKPQGYNDAGYTTLVFVKQYSAIINTPAPTHSPSMYTANSSFAGAGSNSFQYDVSAWCVYKGDTNFVNVSALNNSAAYYVLVYVVRDIDSAYSPSGATTSGSVLSSPPPVPVDVSNVAVNGISQTSIKISWTKPSGYIPAAYTTIVFVKQGVAVSAGTPNKPVTYYIANSTFGLGNGYQNDATARCVFKGDTNFVDVTSVNNNAPWYVLIYVIRDIDSTYSPNGATGNGNALPTPPPAPDIPFVNFTGITTSAAKVRWIKPAGYDDATMTTLVFVKPYIAITAGTPTKAATSYTAVAAAPFGTPYQNDANAKCVFKGDTDFVYLTNLNTGGLYHILVYTIIDTDSSYSTNGAITQGRVLTTPPAPPTDVTSLSFAGLATTAARVSWTKPVAYDNALWSTLVYVKPASAITAGTPTSSVNVNNANAFLGLGSSYQNDASAYCVFKGDTNFVNIGNITNGVPYYVLVYVVTDFDSVYSTPGDTVSGWALPPPPPPPFYTISQINHINNITGVSDSVGVRAGLRGVVYGFNLRPPGVEFLLRDQTGGITVSSASSNFGYTVTEGDSIEIRGTITSARGLFEITALDTLKLLGTGKQIITPLLVSQLDETSENNLVRVNIIKFVSIPTGGVWQPNSNVGCIRIGSGDSISIRIPASSPLVGQQIPSTGAFSIIGMGSQISKSLSAPFSFDGYDIIPRGNVDIIPVDIYSKFNLISPLANTSIQVQNDTATVNKFIWNTCNLNVGFDVIKYTFQLDTITGNFSTPKYSTLTGNSGTDTSVNITNSQLASIIGTKFIPFAGKWRVVASATSVAPFVKNSDSTNTITITIGAFVGIKEPVQQMMSNILIYPNPSNGMINIVSYKSIKNVVIMDMSGKLIRNENPLSTTINIDGSDWRKGIYFLKVTTDDGQLVKRVLIE